MAIRRSRSKKWRHVYPYVCTTCGKRRTSFVFDRAKNGVCTVCEDGMIDETQETLFDVGAP